MKRQKRLRWCVRTSAQRQIEIKDGRFETVLTEQKTRHMDFGYIYYITPPIPHDEFAEQVRLWRSRCPDTDGSESDAYYKGDMNDTYEYNQEDIWIPRQDDSYLAPKGRPLPPIPVTKAVPDRWYDLPEESVSNGSSTGLKRVASLSSYNTETTLPPYRGPSSDVLYVQDDELYECCPDLTNNPIDTDQTERKLAYIGEDIPITRPTTRVPSRRGNSVLHCQTTDDTYTDCQNTAIATQRTKDSPINTHYRVSIGSTGPVIIKKLPMPTITWEKIPEYTLDDRDYEESDNVKLDSTTLTRPPSATAPLPIMPARPRFPPAIQDVVNEEIYSDPDDPFKEEDETLNNNNTYDDPKPEIPPRVPLKPALKQDEVTSEADRRSNASFNGSPDEKPNQSNRTCSICENSDRIPQSLGPDHDELHRLQDKKELLRHQDVFDRAKIKEREKINLGLRKKLHNKSQLNKLETKEQELEEAISNIGKHTQMDEYYAKIPLRQPSCHWPPRTSTSPSLEALYERPIAPLQSFKSKMKSYESDFSFRSKMSRCGKNSFSSNMYGPDSGIEAE